ncbi:histidine phosphatase family protein [Cellulomonas endophytica]|uniref:histidine phosphatase family protein n=1 Tax=Cellulomonas endophytica TaxID=2494735 RepID=UPI001012DC3B|nr:histidine phosphatase family protein [Cellulomonas endophytica]
MLPTTVHLLRHGEVHNPAGVLYGRLPGYRLSERGEAMARTVADHLAGVDGGERHDVTLVVASPLERAQQTAGPLADAFGLEVGTDERLLEAENAFQGLTFGVGDGSLRHPRHWPLLRNPFRPSWGEPYRQQADRMLSAVDSARVRARGHEAVLVSHQLPVWIARLAAEGRPLWHDPRRRQCSLASLTSFRFEDDTLVGIRYSEPAAALLPGANPVPGA